MNSLQHLQVLICQPEIAKLRALRRCLKTLGIDLIWECSAAQIPHSLSQQKPNVVIFGDSFPGLSPLEVLRSIRSHTHGKAAICLLQEGDCTPETLRQLHLAGLDGSLPHPLETAKLQQILSRFLHRERSHDALALLRSCTFFQNFTQHEIDALLQQCHPFQVEAGTCVLAKNDPLDSFYVLLQGEITISLKRTDQPPSQITINAGEAFGEMAVLEQRPRTAPCVARCDSWILELGRHLLQDFQYQLTGKIYHQLARGLSRRLREANIWYAPPLPEPEPQPEERIQEPELDEPDYDQEEEGSDLEDLLPAAASQPSKQAFAQSPPPARTPCRIPCAVASEVDYSLSPENYEKLSTQIRLRSQFITSKIPQTLRESIQRKLYAYWTGAKLAKLNPHQLWQPDSFLPSSTRLKTDLHLVVLWSEGSVAYPQCYLGLPFTQKVIGLGHAGCAGSFCGSTEEIHRYLNQQELSRACQQDLELTMVRHWEGKRGLEYLKHQSLDVRSQSLFLVIDDRLGKCTHEVRKRFPQQQILSVICVDPAPDYDPKDPAAFFRAPLEHLKEAELLNPHPLWKGEGYYAGETYLLPDLSCFFRDTPALAKYGQAFAWMGILAEMGPDYSGTQWGSKGGAKGASKAARSLYGIKGAQNASDLANAVSWADKQS